MQSMKWFILYSDSDRHIVPVQKYLFRKYAPDVRTVWIDLADNPLENWCAKVAEQIRDNRPTESIVVMLADHLLRSRIIRSISMPERLERLELGRRTRNHNSCTNGDWQIMTYSEETPYKVSCQPSIWRTDALLRELDRVDGTPWDFENKGYCQAGIVKEPIIDVADESALSKKWQGVNLRGMKAEDVEEIIKRKYITRDDIRKDN